MEISKCSNGRCSMIIFRQNLSRKTQSNAKRPYLHKVANNFDFTNKDCPQNGSFFVDKVDDLNERVCFS